MEILFTGHEYKDTDMKIGVIGVGRFGLFHCQKYAILKGTELVGIYDSSIHRSKEVAQKLGTWCYSSVDLLIDEVDAVSIATPTVTHFEYARKALLAGVHVFVEKPIAATVAEAEELVCTAEERNLVLQVGHIERFNEALLRASRVIADPKSITSLRTCQYNGRCRDVCVVLDLMIHDLDIVLSYFGQWTKITAEGKKYYDDQWDYVRAVLEFSSGRVAELQANRNALTDERYMSFHCDSEPPININFHQKSNDALMEEVKDFIGSIDKGRRPKVSGADGLLALRAALEIKKGVERNV